MKEKEGGGREGGREREMKFLLDERSMRVRGELPKQDLKFEL